MGKIHTTLEDVMADMIFNDATFSKATTTLYEAQKSSSFRCLYFLFGKKLRKKRARSRVSPSSMPWRNMRDKFLVPKSP